MEYDRNDEPLILPFPLAHIASPGADGRWAEVGEDGEPPALLPFVPPTPFPQPPAA